VWRLSLMTAVALALAATGCGTGDDSAGERGSASAEAGTSSAKLQSSVAATELAKPKVPTGPHSKSLIVKDLREGTGAVAETGDELTVHYVAGIYETGEEIESAWVQGDPYTFQLGAGYQNLGWERGLPGMRVGGLRELVIPTTPEKTPIGSRRGETLVYVVNLLEIN
jgi:peptidylprolyl isomerase